MSDIAFGSTAAARPPAISFEFFPPKNEAQAAMLEDTVARLSSLHPHYVSVTYGAGGTSQERSFGTVRRMRELGFATAAHVTCAGASRASLGETIGSFPRDGHRRASWRSAAIRRAGCRNPIGRIRTAFRIPRSLSLR